MLRPLARRPMKKLLLGTVFSALASAAVAADIPAPVYKAARATAVSASGWYLSVDGAWQSVSLPEYTLGLRQSLGSPFVDDGPMQSFRPHLDSAFVRGSVGYLLPGEASNSIFGANTRLEFGGLYGHASGSQGRTTIAAPEEPAFGSVYAEGLDGSHFSELAYYCGPDQVCRTTSKLSTKYSSWQLHAKVAGDYRVGTVLVTPSLAVFGGNVRNNQTLDQTLELTYPGLDIIDTPATYHARTSLRWTDVGARAGLDLTVDVSPWASFGVSGWAGSARRETSLSGADVGVDNLFDYLDLAGTISSDKVAYPFLANAEAGVAFKLLPAFIVRGFVGLNYDSRVPGISAPSLADSDASTPAGISFHAQTSYYAGGGAMWTFGP